MKRVLRASGMKSGAWLGVFPDNFAAVIDFSDSVVMFAANGAYTLDVLYEDLVKDGFLDRFIRGLHTPAARESSGSPQACGHCPWKVQSSSFAREFLS